ncbi:hypothetical protein ACFQ1S_28430 [Kibdelosporangium lantanae]|uniref:SH3 domain-containing protein n=1 Tax=Kibdelosporangium lantanae TaxID=1497396 RepID=A0ABW3MGH5_9PSEU
MHTKHIRFRYRPRPGWPTAVGVTLTVATGLLLAIIGRNGPTLQPTDLNSGTSADNLIIGTVTGTDRLKVREVADDQNRVNLAAPPVTWLAAGTQVRILCKFTGTVAPGAGNVWYRINGPTIPDHQPGTSTVISASYLDVRPEISVPQCDLYP